MLKKFEEFDPSGKVSATPAAEHLFKIRDDCKPLADHKSKAFHHFTAQGLYLSKQVRQDTGTTVAFLTTHVKRPDEDDWKKLVKYMRYLRGSVYLPLILRADGTGILKWHVDVAYALHWDMKSHTGGNLTLGKGSVTSSSTKQKLNTRNTTESEVVGGDNMSPQILWTNYFLDAQGYGVKDTIIYQDNRSAMLLEKHGRASSSKRTKHTNIRYFFIKDRIDSGEVKAEMVPH